MSNNPAKKLGENIRGIRLEKGLTQGDLAKKLKVEASYLSNIENGNRNPTLATIEKVARTLGVSIEKLIR